jgi:hypothetical protein
MGVTGEIADHAVGTIDTSLALLEADGVHHQYDEALTTPVH